MPILYITNFGPEVPLMPILNIKMFEITIDAPIYFFSVSIPLQYQITNQYQSSFFLDELEYFFTVLIVLYHGIYKAIT